MSQSDESALLALSLEYADAVRARDEARWSATWADDARWVLGEGRDVYDEWGRVAHESVFNVNDGRFRTPATQQGFSGFTTWTRGLAWIMLGYAEDLEFLDELEDLDL